MHVFLACVGENVIGACFVYLHRRAWWEYKLKISVAGKGGVGKTLLAGGLAFSFVRRGLSTIAIDADSSPNLALTLGLSSEEARKIVPLSENKSLIESKTSTGYSGIFRLSFSVDDVVRDFSVKTPFGVNLIVMGTVQSMGSGCMCPANALIRALMRHLVVERDEAVVLDMEAGCEHMGRGTARQVDYVLIVTDANSKSLEVANHIHALATGAGMKQVFLVGNKIANENQKAVIEKYAQENGLKALDFIPFDEAVVEAEMCGETPLKHESSRALVAIEKLCERLVAKNNS
jgi:CO dehydrogenase maturation factor